MGPINYASGPLSGLKHKRNRTCARAHTHAHARAQPESTSTKLPRQRGHSACPAPFTPNRPCHRAHAAVRGLVYAHKLSGASRLSHATPRWQALGTRASGSSAGRRCTCPARNAEGPDEMTPRQWWQYSDCGGGAGCDTMLLLLEHIMDTAEPIVPAQARSLRRTRGARRAAARPRRPPFRAQQAAGWSAPSPALPTSAQLSHHTPKRPNRIGLLSKEHAY
jgi:hypothetical protein